MKIWEEEHSVSTAMKEAPKKFSYKWTIQNFKKYNDMDELRSGEPIRSPLFRTSDSQNYLLLYPKGFMHEEFVSIMLKPQADNDCNKSNVNFFILDNSMKLQNQKEAEIIERKFFGCEEFIRKRELFDTTRNLLNDNDLTIVCTFTKYQRFENSCSDIEQDKCKNKVSLSNDLQKLLQNKWLTDVTLVANDNTLQAHKLILMARSPVFAAMLQHDMKEKMESEIIIKDFSVNVLSEMLQFMYTEEVINIKDNFQDLLYLANKYEIEGLKLVCEEFMLSELTMDNFIDVFILADSQNCHMLKPKLIKFIIQNVKTITENSKFQANKEKLPSWLLEVLEAIS